MDEDVTSAKAALERLRTLPIVMTGGKPLADWLVAETTLTAAQAEQGVEEYRRFLALAMTATPDTPIMPAPKIAQIWAWHRGDTAAWAGFTAAVGRPEALAHRLSRYTLLSAPAYRRTRNRYRACFEKPLSSWWPSKALIGWLRFATAPVDLSLLLIFYFVTMPVSHRPDTTGERWWFLAALALVVFVFPLLASLGGYFRLDIRRKFPHQADLAGPL